MKQKLWLLFALLISIPYAAQCSTYDLAGAWPVIGQNVQNSGVASHTLINPANVNKLVPDWTFVNLIEKGISATPTISDGMVFVVNAGGNVYALDELTGAVIWKKTLAAADRGNATEVFDTSPTLTSDKLFIGSSHMYALDKFTGNLLWDTPVYDSGNYKTDQAANSMVAGENVVVGIYFNNSTDVPASGHYTGQYGRIMAFNQDTGAVAWSLDLSNPTYGTGVGSFSMGGVDIDRNLLFIGTSQNYELPASPLADSLLAIDVNTGALVWKYQFYSNDVWSGLNFYHDGNHDFDVATHPNLFSLTIAGVTEDYVGAGCKDGTYRVFKRDPGAAHVPIVQLKLDPGTLVGGVLTTPVVIGDTIFVSSNAFQGLLGDRTSLDIFYLDNPALFQYNSLAALLAASSKIMALNLKKLVQNGVGASGPVAPPPNTIFWKNTTSAFAYSPTALSYSNGVLFATDFKGKVVGLDARTGVEKFNSIAFPLNFNMALISGGASIHNDRIFVPFGFTVGTPYGGVVSYKLLN